MKTEKRNSGCQIRTVTTNRGVRIIAHGTVLSEVLTSPGPTHSVADVLAAAVCGIISPELPLALLGFEGGGILAPLRAMGGRNPIEAIDVSNRSVKIFDKLCRGWCGDVHFHLADAEVWLRKTRRKFGAVVEDISVESNGDVTQPDSIWRTLPKLAFRQLRSDGIAVFNLLNPEDISWKLAISLIVAPFKCAQLIEFEEFENRIVIAGNHRLSARVISMRCRGNLRRIGSRLANRISISNIKGYQENVGIQSRS